MYCKSVQEWLDVMKSHVCTKKNLVLFDQPMARMMGTSCRGCGQEFHLRLKVIQGTSKDVAEETREQMKTKTGRTQIVASCNR